ncbi:hypothetical protein KO537_07690 [Shewanella sp. NKUCC01_JLK]|uniref:hypothetical protein n=1 Tax=Shewanella sp. NKUCC01_JLK TaxID=2842123 RepID=UPI001C5B0D59|nr:hypothetical protein [Shewanella sp. NKUCC01_JLK]MBW3514602.1 hypothetical protein [Shewanella sp. NKUCC01_JLK]
MKRKHQKTLEQFYLRPTSGTTHVKFAQLYYGKLRDDVNRFIDEKWTPTFLSKAVNNRAFRSDLDDAYLTSSISVDDVSVQWRGRELQEPQKRIVLEGVKQAVAAETSKLGQILIEWSQEAQSQISKKRKSLLDPLNEQERFVLAQINSAFADLQRSQATIKAYLSSAVELKEKQDQVMSKLVALEKVEKVMTKVTDANDKLSDTLNSEDTDKAIEKFLELIESAKSRLQNNDD